jgi:hypothetical protein
LYYEQQRLLQWLLLYSSINRQVFYNMRKKRVMWENVWKVRKICVEYTYTEWIEITSEFTMVTQPSDLCKPHMIASILCIYNFNVLRIMCKSWQFNKWISWPSMQMKMHQSTYALSFLDVKYTSMHLMKDIRGIGKNTSILILRIESLDM